jgi:hypothetical protein
MLKQMLHAVNTALKRVNTIQLHVCVLLLSISVAAGWITGTSSACMGQGSLCPDIQTSSEIKPSFL